jgi:thermostable 8-oxoguanine DNA glycosylase
MYVNSEDYITYLSSEDTDKINKIAKILIHRIAFPQLGLYRLLSEEDLWFNLLLQFCVVGGADMLENLRKKETEFSEFKEQLSLRNLLSGKDNRREYISKMLRNHKATRFYNKQAERVDAVLDNTSVVNNGKFVMLQGLDHNAMDYHQIRSTLMKRNPFFRLKSASEFMIETGLSIGVIALSTRVVNVLKDLFGLQLDSNKIQDTRTIYESVESALGGGCERIGLPLAYFDRMLFHYSGKDSISFILEDL